MNSMHLGDTPMPQLLIPLLTYSTEQSPS